MKPPILIAALMTLPVLAWPQQAFAQTTRYVDNVRACAGLPPCYPTIMDAVGAAVPSDSIEVFAGVYHESVVFDATKNHIVLRAHSQALMPVIEAPSGGNNAVTIQAASGVQVLNFVLEAPESAGVATSGFSSDVLVQGNLITSQRGVSAPVGSGRVINNTVQGG
jgi:pectin methylesterase-like acyl-CoA thioesterase